MALIKIKGTISKMHTPFTLPNNQRVCQKFVLIEPPTSGNEAATEHPFLINEFADSKDDLKARLYEQDTVEVQCYANGYTYQNNKGQESHAINLVLKNILKVD